MNAAESLPEYQSGSSRLKRCDHSGPDAAPTMGLRRTVVREVMRPVAGSRAVPTTAVRR